MLRKSRSAHLQENDRCTGMLTAAFYLAGVQTMFTKRP